MTLVMRVVRADPAELQTLRSLLGRPLDEVRAEDLSWLPAEERFAAERRGYLEVQLRAGDLTVSVHAEPFQTPPPPPRAKLHRAAALLAGGAEHEAWREGLSGERARRNLGSPGAPLARDLGAVAQVQVMKTLFWPRRGADASLDEGEWRFVNPKDTETIGRAAGEASSLEVDVAMTEFDLGIAVVTSSGRRVVLSTAGGFVAVTLDAQGVIRPLTAPEPL